ncbi:hypothetical protein KM043_011106 [Ampulex compressa]|nr:hypothetical protein KM043_011106 [Ampulex compressa]
MKPTRMMVRQRSPLDVHEEGVYIASSIANATESLRRLTYRSPRAKFYLRLPCEPVGTAASLINRALLKVLRGGSFDKVTSDLITLERDNDEDEEAETRRKMQKGRIWTAGKTLRGKKKNEEQREGQGEKAKEEGNTSKNAHHCLS